MAKVPINKTIKENRHILPGSFNSQKRINKDPVLIHSMVSKLRSAYKFRKEYVTDLFQHEITTFSSSLTIDLSGVINARNEVFAIPSFCTKFV